MKKVIAGVLILVGLMSACATKRDYVVSTHLTAQEQVEMMDKVIRYVGRAPEGLTFEERFYPAYDSFYREQAGLHKFDAFFKNGSTYYFLISRRAPSLVDKRVATGGKFIWEAGKVTEYEEMFRTWKMLPDTLARREMILFDKLVAGESLQPYQTKYSNGIEYIEFPDERTYFDKASRQWKTR